MRAFLSLTVFSIITANAFAVEFQRAHRFGKATAARVGGYDGAIRFASWIDEQTIVFATASGTITCLSLRKGKTRWKRPGTKPISNWSVSRRMGRLAFIQDGRVLVIDCSNGKTLFRPNAERLSKLLRIDSIVPSRAVLIPNDGRLIICNTAWWFGRHAYVLDAAFQRRVSSFELDAWPRELSVSSDGRRVALIADKNVVSVRNVVKNSDLFFRGKRVPKPRESNSITFSLTIDAPFYSHVRHDGRDTVVYTQDNSWATGNVFVQNIASKSPTKFDARNGHIELDVDFSTKRIVLTGTSRNLTLVNFDGKVLAEAKAISLQRNLCVEFSPSNSRVQVGSWDNTISVFAIKE